MFCSVFLSSILSPAYIVYLALFVHKLHLVTPSDEMRKRKERPYTRSYIYSSTNLPHFSMTGRTICTHSLPSNPPVSTRENVNISLWIFAHVASGHRSRTILDLEGDCGGVSGVSDAEDDGLVSKKGGCQVLSVE